MGKNKRNNHARSMKYPPRSVSAIRRRALRPDQIDVQQAVSVADLVKDRTITVNGKGEIYVGE